MRFDRPVRIAVLLSFALHLAVRAAAEPTFTKLADGCYHVFLDVGANVGIHSRFLFQPELFPRALYSKKIFDPWFGLAQERAVSTTCSFAFEPNPAHREAHAMLAANYAKKGWRYHFFPAGVGALDSKLTFYSNNAVAGGARHHSWGFSTKCRDAKCGDNVTVPIMDLDAFINAHVIGRRLPPGPRGPPRVVVKMDIETAE